MKGHAMNQMQMDPAMMQRIAMALQSQQGAGMPQAPQGPMPPGSMGQPGMMPGGMHPGMPMDPRAMMDPRMMMLAR